MRKIIKFIKSVIDEVKKVEWLSKKELVNYTVLTLVFLIVSTIIIALIDINLVKLRTYIIGPTASQEEVLLDDSNEIEEEDNNSTEINDLENENNSTETTEEITEEVTAE